MFSNNDNLTMKEPIQCELNLMYDDYSFNIPVINRTRCVDAEDVNYYTTALPTTAYCNDIQSVFGGCIEYK